MKKLHLPGMLAGILFACGLCAHAQAPDSLNLRKSVLAEARYLKSICKTDEAIEKLSELVVPGVFDEDVLAELADCHFQGGDYSSAAGTYFMLSSRSPGNILYRIRQMQTYSRLKAWLDKAIDMLQPDPATMSRIHQQYGLCYYRMQDISALSTVAYCYEQKKDYRQAVQWYERYLQVARPGSQGYEFAAKSIEYLKGELFMEEK